MNNEATNISNELFLKLHQLQINLIKNTSKQTINDYYKNIIDLLESEKSIDQENLQSEASKLVEFLLFPVLTVLKRNEFESAEKSKLNSDSKEILIKTLSLILTKIKLFNFDLFQDLLNICSILLSKYKLDRQYSEEFLCSCFQLIQILFKRSSKIKVLDNFYKFSSLTTIGLLVSIFLDTLSETGSIQVRLEALNCLKSLTNFKNFNYENSQVIKNDLIGNLNYQNRISILFASFLPGISIKLIQKFLLGENLKLLNHKLICSCLELFAHVISSVLSDILLEENIYKIYFNSTENEKPISNDIKTLIIDRTLQKDWLEQSGEKIFLLIERMLDSLITHENYHVKLSLIQFCSIVSNQCYISLNKHLPKLLKVIVSFAANSEQDLGKEACKSIDLLENKEIKSNLNCKYVALNRLSVLDSCMEEILIKLPRIMNSKTELSDDYRLSHLRTLYGFLKLIGQNLEEFFQTNSNNLNQFIQGLICCVSFDFKSLSNFYEIENKDNLLDSSANLSNYIGLKTYLDDKIVFEQLSSICFYLGKSDSAQLIIDQMINFDFIYRNENFKIQVMFLINLILNGLAEKKESYKQISNCINLVLSNFLNDFNESDQIETLEESLTNKRNKLILQTCLTLEAIRISSKCLNPEDYNMFLIDTLYFALENYLNSNLLVRVVSTQCLHDLALNLGFSSIQELLSANFDYIMNDLILKSNNQIRSFRFNENQQEQLDKQSAHIYVLCALLEISNKDLVPYLERIIDDYLFAIRVQTRNSNLLLGVCRVMAYFSKAIRRWYPIKFNFIENSNDLFAIDLEKFGNEKKKKDYTKSFYENLQEIEFSIKQEFSKETTQEQEEEIQEEEAKKIPLHVELETKCLQVCTHLISHPFKQIRLQIIEIIKELCRNLAENTNEFLPLVHKLWSPVCHRFSLDDLIVKSKIMSLLFELSVLCGDFLSSRFCKEFLPRLCSFMSEQAKVSAKSNLNDPTYVYSHAYKLQCAILMHIDKMCVLFEIKELELESLIESVVLVYLDKKQPKKLQSLALQAVQNCSLIDSDIVWICLHYVLPFTSILYDDNFKEYKKLIPSSQIKHKYNFSFNRDILFALFEIFSKIYFFFF